MRFITLSIIVALISITSFAQENTMTDTAPKIKFKTTLGNFIIQLDPKNAPISSANFLKYVDSGFYQGTIFHRIIPNFMAQGGGFASDLQQKAQQPTIQNEADNGLKNDRGTLAMARTNAPHSASTQFFINYKDNTFLNHTNKSASGWGYAVFAKVIGGMEVIDAMEAVSTHDKGGHQNVPTTDIIVEDIAVIK